MDRDSKMDQRSLAMIVGGAVLTVSALARPRSTSSRWATALGLLSVASGCFWSRRLSAALDRLWQPPQTPVDDAIDQASSDSFPASDAPASIPASAAKT